MKKVKLLPHVWQKIGLGLLSLSLLVFLICFKAAVHDMFLFSSNYGYDAFGQGWAHMLIVVFFTIGVVLMAVSEETAEDERITYIRHQAIIRTIILYLIVALLNVPFSFFLASHADKETMMQILIIKRFIFCTPAFILYYLLIFKVYLWADNKRLGHEE